MPPFKNFGDALELLKAGRKVARTGWNGKDMYLYLLTEFVVIGNGGTVVTTSMSHYQPCVVMKTAQGLHQPGWLASQADMLAEDWVEVDE
jgi:hypothetical protein